MMAKKLTKFEVMANGLSELLAIKLFEHNPDEDKGGSWFTIDAAARTIYRTMAVKLMYGSDITDIGH